jgi:hypothetical protein
MGEAADPGERHHRCRGMHSTEGDRDVLRHRPLDRADEAQRQVELVIRLPPRRADAAHRGEQALADRRGRTQCDEKPGHAAL